MGHKHELVMYTRTAGCPFVTTAKRVLEAHQVPYRQIFIDKDDEAKARVLAWTGFLSVPTLVLAEPDSDMPYTEFTSLAAGESPRGIDRGPMLTEATTGELEAWLTKHGFI